LVVVGAVVVVLVGGCVVFGGFGVEDPGAVVVEVACEGPLEVVVTVGFVPTGTGGGSDVEVACVVDVTRPSLEAVAGVGLIATT